MGNTVKVDLKNTVGFQGKNYGPGKGVEVPEKLARGLGLSASVEAAEAHAGSGDTPDTLSGGASGTGTKGDGEISGTAKELDLQYDKAELAAEADRRGLKVKRSDNGDGDVRKQDYVMALASDSSVEDRASVAGE